MSIEADYRSKLALKLIFNTPVFFITWLKSSNSDVRLKSTQLHCPFVAGNLAGKKPVLFGCGYIADSFVTASEIPEAVTKERRRRDEGETKERRRRDEGETKERRRRVTPS